MNFIGFVFPEWLIFLILVAGAYLCSMAFVFVFEKVMEFITRKTTTKLDDILLEHSRGPLRIICFFGFLYAFFISYFPGIMLLGKTIHEVMTLIMILAVSHLAAALVNGFLQFYFVEAGSDSRIKSKVKLSKDVYPILKWLLALVIYIAAFFIFFNRLGIDLTPLLAIPTILSLGVGLALQDTMKNFFAGLYLLSNKPVKVGDLISLNNETSEIKGFVEEINWRTSKIKNLNGNYMIIPNDMVSNSIIINFSSVENPLKTSKISIGVAYGSDVSQVIDLMQKAVLSVEKKSKDLLIDLSFQPTVNFTDFGDSALKFTLIFKHKNLFSGQVETAVREEIFGLFNKNKIEIPYPIQTIKLEKS